LGREGLDKVTKTPGKPQFSAERGTESGTLPDDSSEKRPAMDADLAEVVNAWPTLSAPIRAGILAMIRAK
jgi:hypothetical protein